MLGTHFIDVASSYCQWCEANGRLDLSVYSIVLTFL
jgi:hypothetical protein